MYGDICYELRLKNLEFKFYKSTISVHQEGHPEFKALRCSSKTSGSKAIV